MLMLITAHVTPSLTEVVITSALSPAACSALADALASASETQSHTRWWSASNAPQTPLEHAAAAVFAHHTDGLPFTAALSGAEYWVKFHVEDADGDRGPLGGGVHLRAPRALHPFVCSLRLTGRQQHPVWNTLCLPLFLSSAPRARHTWLSPADRDFDIGGTGYESFPNMSTITYLTTAEAAMPTLIFPGLTIGDSFGSSAAHSVWVVYPAAGKHVRFDGTLWHGVPPAAVFAPGATAARRVGRVREQRVTLLVNLWLDVRSSVAAAVAAAAPHSSTAAQQHSSTAAQQHSSTAAQQQTHSCNATHTVVAMPCTRDGRLTFLTARACSRSSA